MSNIITEIQFISVEPYSVVAEMDWTNEAQANKSSEMLSQYVQSAWHNIYQTNAIYVA